MLAAVHREGNVNKVLLEIARELGLPLAVATGRTAFTGQSDSGKTYAAMKLAELMLACGIQVIGADSVGCWYGLKFGKDGRKPGFPIAVFGGINADLPLPPDSGKVVAEVLARSRMSAVLDFSEFTVGESSKFVAAFAEHFFHAKKRNKTPVCIFWEEAQNVAPQELPPDPNAALMLNRVVRIVKVGRNYGIGNVLVTQEPQAVAKRALSQVHCLFIGRMQAPHAQDAVRKWVAARASKEEVALLGDLDKLDQGEMLVSEPKWFKTIRRVRIAEKRTFDSSRTPEVGEEPPAPGKAADVDLTQLRADLSEMIARDEAQDPTVLTRRVAEKDRRIAELERELAKKPAASPPAPAKVQRVEVPVISEKMLARLERAAKGASVAAEVLARHAQPLIDGVEQSRKAYQDAIRLKVHTEHFAGAPPPAAPRTAAPPPPTRRPIAPAVAPRATPAPPSAAGEPLGKGERIVLTAVAQHPGGVIREQLTVLTGYKRSTRDAYVQRLRGRNLVADGERITATDAGLAELGPEFEQLPTGVALLEHWRRRLPPGELACLEVLVAVYPEGLAREEVGERTTPRYQRSSRDAYLQRLRARQLITEPARGLVRASDTLFDTR